MKIPVKLILCYLVTIVSVFLLVNLLGSNVLERSLLEQMGKEYYTKVQKIAEEYVVRYYNSELSTVQVMSEFENLDSIIDARIWLVNSRNIVIIDTRSKTGINLDAYDSHFLENTISENVELEGVFTEPMLSVTEPVLYDYAVRGYVCLHVPMALAAQRTARYMDVINMCLLAVSSLLFIAFTVVYIITVRPIRKARKAALEYAKGNYTYPMGIRTRDEFGDLADALTYMAGEIKNVDDYQKKFIANISHDFRSPLTSIKGYAEAIKDGTIPPEAQNRYLDVILFEADRLSKLTSNLLDLNRMDSKGLMLDITSFDINTVIKNVAAAFEGICTERKIMLDLTFASFETLVDADMGRIQQVLYNLTDNAIKFSNSGSKVEIETEEKGSKVLVRVRDHGAGIPRDSIKKIWDRFYKSDSSRGKDKKGTGLGLSIVKEIITAHEENINVISTEGVGTEFTFTLPLS